VSVRARHGWAAESAEMERWARWELAGFSFEIWPLAPSFPCDILVFDGTEVTRIEVKSARDRYHAYHPTLTPPELAYARAHRDGWLLARYHGRERLPTWNLSDYEEDVAARRKRKGPDPAKAAPYP
jgi:hypothetical protein